MAVLIQHTPLEDWLDSNEVKKLLKISERTLQTLRSNGTLAYSKLNGKLYYRRQDLQDLLSHNYKFSRNNKET
ncbi:MAG: helix-turn-helix domain-containing protein [Bacteroidales bacterium]|nr:helix-turn-helix domain-containing protein [Bacteroidales bacterium]